MGFVAWFVLVSSCARKGEKVRFGWVGRKREVDLMRIALVNDYKTRIPKVRTLWHFLEDSLNAQFFSLKDKSFKEKIGEYKPNVIITNSFWGDLGLSRTAPIVALVQDNYPLLMKYGMLDSEVCKYHINRIKNAVNSANKVVVIFSSMIESFDIPKDKAVRIPVGTDSNTFYPSKIEREWMRAKLRINGKCNIFVGDETPIHGWGEVTNRIKENEDEYWILVSKHKPTSFKRNISAIIRGYISEGNARNFYNVNHDMLRALYNSADLFYARGHIGLPAIEAMFCGIPVDVSRTGYFEDWYPANKNPRQEVMEAGFELKDTLLSWRKLVSSLLGESK